MKTSSNHGFTLIELLTVIGIIVILAALLFPVFGTATRNAENAACTVNMRNIGSGFRAYAAENEGTLPGPLFTGQGPWYNRDARRLQTRLGKYLDIPLSNTWSTSASQMTYSKLFQCPSAKRKSQPGATTFYMNLAFKVDGRSPFGAGDADGNGVLDKPGDTPGMTQMQLANSDPDKVWMMAELDQKFPGLGKPGWFDGVPVEPYHGKHRNALFFDMHVGRLNLDNTPQ